MPVPDKRVDTYIEKSAPFAKPILEQLRKVVHHACPGVAETMKWSFPHFIYNGSNLCSMASFKQHCAFGFWLGSLMKDPKGIFNKDPEKAAMGNLGQIKCINDLPDTKILTDYIREAMNLADRGVKLSKKSPGESPKNLPIPDYFLAALKTNKAASDHFEAFPFGQKKEYIEWITGAKTEVTRQKRLATALEWIAAGKGKNWKYE